MARSYPTPLRPPRGALGAHVTHRLTRRLDCAIQRRVVPVQEPVFGDDRLAFVLGHELAHLMQDHFWHIKYFQSWKQSQGATMPSAQPAGLSLDQLQHQEFQADTHGILYATMAGFNPQAVVPNDRKVNFFQAWLQAWRPLGHRVTSSGTHPNAEQRDEVLRISLQRVAHQAAAFQAGLWWLYAGDYGRAVQAFKQFLDLFPAREVYHNLALSHHLLALQAYQLWQPNTPVFPFQLTLAIEPVTRANRLYAHSAWQHGAENAGAVISSSLR